MNENSEEKAVMAYLNLQLAIEMRLGLSHKDAKAKVMADFMNKVGTNNKQTNMWLCKECM